MISPMLVLVAALAAAAAPDAGPRGGRPAATPVNIIDGADDRDSLLVLGPTLGLSPTEIARIRTVTGFVGCLSPSPSLGAGALFLTDRQVLTAAHILFEPSGRRRSRCFFRTQAPSPETVDLVVEGGGARFGAERPKAGSAADFAVVQLARPIAGALPFPPLAAAPAAGERLVVVTAHPAGMAREVDKAVPVVQGCTVRRALAPRSPDGAATFRTDCDATGSSSGGLNLVRTGDGLRVAGITVSTGPWRNPRLVGAPYSEKAGSLTVALAAAGAITAAGRALAAAPPVAAAPPRPLAVEGPAPPGASALTTAPAHPAGQPGATGQSPTRQGSARQGAAPQGAAGPPQPAPTDHRRALGLGLDSTYAPSRPPLQPWAPQP